MLVALLIAIGVAPVTAAPRGQRQPRPHDGAATLSNGGVETETTLPLQTPPAASASGVGRLGAPACRPSRDVLTYHGGALVTHPDIFVIFWGTQWQTDQEHIDAKAALLGLFQETGSSGYACSWREYEVPGMTFGAPTLHTPSSEIIPNAPPSPLSDAAIQQRIALEVSLGNAPPRTNDMIYVVVPPRGIPVRAPDGSTGCGGSNFVFCAYHDSFAVQSAPFRYAVLPFPCNSGGFTCFVDPTDNVAAALQVSGSHELSEIVTDPDGFPVGASGWGSDQTGSENADICAADGCIGSFTSGAQSFQVNSLWSNLAKGCVDSVPCSPQPVTCTDPTPGACIAGRSRSNQCSIEWLVDPNLTQVRNGLPGRTVTCRDGQPFCDFDGVADGQCTFHVAACLNSADPRVPCTQSPITSVHLLAPRLTSTDPNQRGLAQAVLATLQGIDPGATGSISGAQVGYNPPASTANACSSYLDVTVPLRQSGLRSLTGRRRLSLSTQTANGHVSNRLTLVCNP